MDLFSGGLDIVGSMAISWFKTSRFSRLNPLSNPDHVIGQDNHVPFEKLRDEYHLVAGGVPRLSGTKVADPVDDVPDIGLTSRFETSAPAGGFTNWIYTQSAGANRRAIALAMFAVWLVLVGIQSWTHLVWRDEVRAFSKAMQGDTVFGMLKSLKGEGHPAVWYLIMRAAHALVPRPESVLLAAVVVGAAAILILVLRAPFTLPVLALLLCTRFSLYEYSVMARNYGVSMLLLFLYAALYEKHRKKGCVLGLLLFLMANCNVHSVVLAGGLLLFWFMDTLRDGPALRRNLRVFLLNAALAGIGVLICCYTIFPTVNDSAAIDSSDITLKAVLEGLFLPPLPIPAPAADRLLAALPWLGLPLAVLRSLIFFGSTLGLIRRPGAFLAGLTTLVAFSLIFTIIYPGDYRHTALWVVFLIALYWMARPGPSPRDPSVLAWLPAYYADRIPATGTLLFLVLLLLQLPYSAITVFDLVRHPAATFQNRRNSVRRIFQEHPELEQSVIVANPDFLVETLPYYLTNPTYLLREHRYGNVVRFTRYAQLELSLADLLENTRRLRQDTGRPVVILLMQKPDPEAPAHVVHQAYEWRFKTSPEQVAEFLASTRFLGYHEGPSHSGESYYAYALDK